MSNEEKSSPAAAFDRRQAVKLAIDLGPLLVFFAAYLAGGIYWATGSLMVSIVAAVIASRLVLGHLTPTLIATAVLVLGFGAMTLWLHDPSFIKMKPTIINVLFAVVLLAGLALKRPLLKHLLGEAFKLTDRGWRVLTIRWSVFFLGLAALNELVWRTMSEATWASFKVFGILTLTMLFFASQWGLIQRHQMKVPEHGDNRSTP